MEFVDALEGPSENGSHDIESFSSEHNGNSAASQIDEIKPGEEIEKNIDEALTAKAEGNEFYKKKEYDDAIQSFTKAIKLCPEDELHKEQMAIFFGNRSACYYTMNEYELTIEDCTHAITNNPKYLKVIIRRSQAYEMILKYEEALSDAKTVQELDPCHPKIQETIKRLERLHEEKMNKLKDEALGKLKDLGNTILGNFGMSLDNFKMNQDPASGSWNISMNS
mmetsp:Transcript_37855/g.38541  ORF Transcript_37855/g.38541 Transcript_37855/m.38541 type:complete len:223 (+) Transcript_37855:137-805(+)|eukprot:CAMPEP_0182418198 /NCGR_PEP_ID=MMETSP1167-20130531/2678_1 /TAXON_ID=2988 /ORGANISM="Mallomonas Sp, Strain CCMP3275" /LENGTH=222 /DNA_ID=CAMNT_0024592283 /DNA_START=134 /DNA_END=802 /DNA_ORIENTATION=+